METWQILSGVVFVIVCGLVGVIYYAGQSRDDKQDRRADRNERSIADHIRDDTQAHERLTRVETKVDALQTEVRSLRDMRHEIMEHTSHALASWYQKIVEMISKLGK